MTDSALKVMKTMVEPINSTELSCQMALLTTSTGLKFINMSYSEFPLWIAGYNLDSKSHHVIRVAEYHPMPHTDPIVIAHRGASGYLPEHTLEAYSLAIEQGADFIEPDLVSTKDGVLIARHEPNIINTTDGKDRVEFRDRKRKAMIDGVEEEGYFTADFTLAEIKTLGAVQQFADRDQSWNGRFKVPTFAEIIDLAQHKSRQLGRTIGVYPETKHPAYHHAIGLPLEDRLVDALSRAGWNHRDAPVFIQSFEPASLRYLRKAALVKLVQLVAASGVAPDGSLEFVPPYDRPYDWTLAADPRYFHDLVTPRGFAEVSTYADGVGLWKRYIVSARAVDTTAAAHDEAKRVLLAPSSLIESAHRVGLLVHAWTFRNEPHRLARDYQADPINEYLQFYRLSVDGVFSDFPDTAIAARMIHRRESLRL